MYSPFLGGGRKPPILPQGAAAPLPVRRVTSIYWGFFSGGARNVHTDIIQVLQNQGISNNVINYYDSVDRGAEGTQSKESDANYRRLIASGIAVNSLGLTHHNSIDLNGKIEHFSGTETPANPLESIVQDLAYKLLFDNSDAILCLKEQPANLLVLANRYLVEVMGKAPKPIFITLHRTDPEIQDRHSIETLRELEHNPETKKYITGYIACAESAMMAYQNALGLALETSRFTFVPNGIDFGVFHPMPAKDVRAAAARVFAHEPYPPLAHSPVVTIGARNSAEKNIGLFIEAAFLLLRSSPKSHAVMCGSGMDRNGLRELVHQAAQSLCIPAQETDLLQKRMHPVGRVTSHDMAALLNISDVVALTSPTLGEADPLVLKEGMLCGAIPVTTCSGDAPRVVGINNPEQQMLRPVQEAFIIGSRGILTSQKSADIAAAWRYVMAHRHKFSRNIEAYRPQLSREAMGKGYKKRIAELIALHRASSAQNWPNPFAQTTAGILAAVSAPAASDQPHVM